MLLVAEIFGDGQRGQRHPPARAGRLVHLAVDQHRARQHAGALHVGQQFVAFAGPLADAGEHRDALVFLDHGVDQFHHQHGLADAGAAEHRRLAALRQRRQQVDHLDAGLEHRGRRGLVLERRRRRRGCRAAACRPAAAGPRSRTVADDVEQAAQNRIADRHRNRARRSRAPPCRGRDPRWPAARWRGRCRGSRWLCTSRTSGSGRSHSTISAVLIGGSDGGRRSSRPRPRL